MIEIQQAELCIVVSESDPIYPDCRKAYTIVSGNLLYNNRLARVSHICEAFGICPGHNFSHGGYADFKKSYDHVRQPYMVGEAK